MNKELPYTIRTLRNTLTSILGDERLYSLEVVNNDYLLMFELKAEFQNKLKEIVKMLREVVPANMGIASRLTMHQTAPIFLAAHTTTAMHVTVLPYIPQPIHQSTNASVGAFLTIASHIKVLPFIAKSISDSTGAQFRAFQKSGQRFTIKPN